VDEQRATDAPRVLVVGQDALARRGLSALLDAHGALAVLGDAAPGAELEARLERLAPDVLVWDVPAGAPAAAELAAALEPLAVPVLALVGGPAQAEEALAAGARAVLARDADAETIAVAALALRQRLVTLDEALARTLLPFAPAGAAEPPEALTPREGEVLRLIAEGLSNRAIAERLAISEHTAKFHVASILAKLGAQTRTEAVVRAARLGLVYL
jgi:two-component system, NarL family, nitrate/nitrite response regulator NarL